MNPSQRKPAKLVLLCGPSGAGKGTVISELLQRHPTWKVVDSYSTRQPRVLEGTKKIYHFISPEEFMHLVKEGEIIEYETLAGNLYGTSKASLDAALATAPVVLLELNIQGIRAIKDRYPEAMDLYLRVSAREVRRRLAADWRRRNTPRREMLARLALVALLNRRCRHFTYIVDSVNGSISTTVDHVEKVILGDG